MSRFFTSWGVVLAAWLVVLGAMGGGLTLALLQPPGVSPSEPATIAVGPDEAPPESAADHAAGRGMAGNGQGAPGGESIDSPEATPAQTAAAPTVGPEAAASEPETAAAETPPGPATDPQASPGTPAAGPAEENAPAPEQASEHAGEAAHGEAAEPDKAGSEGATAEETQVANIPTVPPAPEELAYWERYRQPFNMEDRRPRIAVVLSGLGLSESATEAAINKLPAAVTLSFSPYARDLERWIALARARGHEVMLDLPMEPASFPNEDPGPQGLLTHLTAEDNLDRLDWVLSRGSAYVGLAGQMGSRFTASRSDVEPILRDVKDRGLIFLDRRTTEDSVVQQVAQEIGLPAAVNNRSVDERQASRVAIDARLAQIERIALTDGFAVAMAQPYPVTLNRLADWATELTGRGFVIAPISALADRQKRP